MMIITDFNPILRREIRARWRKWPAFAVVLGYTVLFACAVAWSYAKIIGQDGGEDTGTNSALLGHDLFQQLNTIQLIGWIALAPLLTAPAIAGEREKGLLEGVQMSQLTPRAIVMGKLYAALSFIGLMLLVPLPTAAICFQMGGISPLDFALSFTLNAVTAVTCASIGLNCSAHKRTTPQAVLSAMVGSFVFLCIPLLSPLYAGVKLLDNQGIVYWGLSIFLQTAMTITLLRGAERSLLRPLPDPLPPAPARPSVLTAAATGYSPDYSYLPVLSVEPEDDDPDRYKRWDMPLAHYLRFENPVLHREVRTRLRMRQTPTGRAPSGSSGWLTMLAVFFAVYGCIVVFQERSVEVFYWGAFSSAWLFAVIAAAAVQGAMAFTRERETNMLEPLLMTPLTCGEIMWGKLFSILVVCAYYSLAVLPVLIPCLVHIENGNASLGIAPWTAAATAGIVFASAWCATALGTYLSWLARYTLISVGATGGILLIAMLVLPLFANSNAPQPGALNPFFWHPFASLTDMLHDKASPSQEGVSALCGALLLFGIGTTLILLLLIAMRHGPRERDRAHLTQPSHETIDVAL